MTGRIIIDGAPLTRPPAKFNIIYTDGMGGHFLVWATMTTVFSDMNVEFPKRPFIAKRYPEGYPYDKLNEYQLDCYPFLTCFHPYDFVKESWDMASFSKSTNFLITIDESIAFIPTLIRNIKHGRQPLRAYCNNEEYSMSKILLYSNEVAPIEIDYKKMFIDFDEETIDLYLNSINPEMSQPHLFRKLLREYSAENFRLVKEHYGKDIREIINEETF